MPREARVLLVVGVFLVMVLGCGSEVGQMTTSDGLVAGVEVIAGDRAKCNEIHYLDQQEVLDGMIGGFKQQVMAGATHEALLQAGKGLCASVYCPLADLECTADCIDCMKWVVSQVKSREE